MTYPVPFPKPAVSALILDGGSILLVKRGHEPSLGLWSLPGGGIELGETASEAIAREVFEETGLSVEPADIAGVRDVIGREDGDVAFHYVIICFRVRVISGTPVAGSDAVEVRWVPLADLPSYPLTTGLLDWLLPLTT